MEVADTVVSKLYIYSKENSTTSETGALTINGGIGVSKDIYVQGTVQSNKLKINNITVTSGKNGATLYKNNGYRL